MERIEVLAVTLSLRVVTRGFVRWRLLHEYDDQTKDEVSFASPKAPPVAHFYGAGITYGVASNAHGSSANLLGYPT